MATMKIAQNNNSKLRYCIDKTKRFFRRARDLYMDSMVSLEGKVARTNVIVCQAIHVSHLPSDLYRGSSTTANGCENIDKFYQSISEKYSHRSDMELEFDEAADVQVQRRVAAMDRSYSVVLGRIGTIDEEEPCVFNEDVPFSRCRSYAVARNNGL